MRRIKHICDKNCVCPIHRTDLIYWVPGYDHACQDIDCVWAHGDAPNLKEYAMQGVSYYG